MKRSQQGFGVLLIVALVMAARLYFQASSVFELAPGGRRQWGLAGVALDVAALLLLVAAAVLVLRRLDGRATAATAAAATFVLAQAALLLAHVDVGWRVIGIVCVLAAVAAERAGAGGEATVVEPATAGDGSSAGSVNLGPQT